MSQKQKLGPLQQEWVDRLRKHPEKQLAHRLGEKHGDGEHEYNACCLGECSMMLAENGLGGGSWKGDVWMDELSDTLLHSYEIIGLKSDLGVVTKGVWSNGTLSSANDNGLSWIELADFIEAHPEAVFTKSV